MGAKNIAYINCKMLEWARKQSPLELEDIPIRIKGMKSEQVEKWEKGIEAPSIIQAKKLANLYDIPFAALYLTELPKKENKNYIDRRTFKDNLNIEISYELWKEINRLKSCRESAVELANTDKYNNILEELNVTDTLEHIAEEIRKIFNIKTPFKNKSAYNARAFNFFRNLIEKKGIMVLQIEGISIKEIRGLSLNYKIFPIIAVNKSDSDRAKVFTLFHELSHLVRRTSNLCLIDFNEREDEEEKICNTLAANILIPQNVIDYVIDINLNDDKEIEKLSDKFAVSKFVIIKRLLDLKIIDYNLYKSKYDKYLSNFNAVSKNINRQNEKIIVTQDKKLISTNGRLYPKIVLDAYYDGKISFGEVCNTLNINANYISNIERMVLFSE